MEERDGVKEKREVMEREEKKRREMIGWVNNGKWIWENKKKKDLEGFW